MMMMVTTTMKVFSKTTFPLVNLNFEQKHKMLMKQEVVSEPEKICVGWYQKNLKFSFIPLIIKVSTYITLS